MTEPSDPNPPAPATLRIDVGGAALHGLDWGGEGTPVLFVHGLGQSAHIFRTLVPALGPGVRAVAVTLRAHGESDTPETGYTFATFAADLARALDALGIERAAVVAHSIGGGVATRLAVDHPGRVAGVVYLDSLTDYASIGRIGARNPARPPALRPGAGDAAERAWHRLHVYGTWNDALEADWHARPDRATRHHRHELLAALMDEAARIPEPFARLTVPALALMARESVATQFPWLAPGDPRIAAAETYLREVRGPWRRAAAERFRREAPLARVAEIPGNHFFFLTETARTAAEIRAFLLST